MKLNRRQLTKAALLGSAAAQAQTTTRITHGPFLGHSGPNFCWVWGRTERAGQFRIRYGTNKNNLDQTTPPITTSIDHDNSAWFELKNLKSNTRYYYQLDGSDKPGTFKTHPAPEDFRHPETNPRGLFNFSFAFGSCAQQRVDPALPAYQMLNKYHASKMMFSVMNGDWLYEEKREYPATEWRKQVGIDESQTPRIVKLNPSITGVWENYKLYLERGVPLSEWHRNVPGYFTTDDHEILNDVFGTGSAGVKSREAVFRDISLQAWYDYIAGSHPLVTKQGLHFGAATVQGDILTDNEADFSKLDKSEISNLHIHWGGQLAGIPPGRKRPLAIPKPASTPSSNSSARTASALRPSPLKMGPARTPSAATTTASSAAATPKSICSTPAACATCTTWPIPPNPASTCSARSSTIGSKPPWPQVTPTSSSSPPPSI